MLNSVYLPFSALALPIIATVSALFGETYRPHEKGFRRLSPIGYFSLLVLLLSMPLSLATLLQNSLDAHENSNMIRNAAKGIEGNRQHLQRFSDWTHDEIKTLKTSAHSLGKQINTVDELTNRILEEKSTETELKLTSQKVIDNGEQAAKNQDRILRNGELIADLRSENAQGDRNIRERMNTVENKIDSVVVALEASNESARSSQEQITKIHAQAENHSQSIEALKATNQASFGEISSHLEKQDHKIHEMLLDSKRLLARIPDKTTPPNSDHELTPKIDIAGLLDTPNAARLTPSLVSSR